MGLAFDQMQGQRGHRSLDAVEGYPADLKHVRTEFDFGDHVHPNDAGNAAIANGFDLSTFTN